MNMDSNQPKGYPWPEPMTPDYDNDTMPVSRGPQYGHGQTHRSPEYIPEDTFRINNNGQVPAGAVIRGSSIKSKQRKKPIAILTMLGIVFLLIVALAVVIFLPGSNGDQETQQAAPAAHRQINIPAAQSDNTLSYGEWDGQFRYGQPDGNGTLKFTKQRLISMFDKKHTVAQPGDYIIGEYDNGQLIHGRLYRTDGTTTDIFCDPPASDDSHP